MASDYLIQLLGTSCIFFFCILSGELGTSWNDILESIMENDLDLKLKLKVDLRIGLRMSFT